MANQVARILMAEQIFPGGHGAGIKIAKGGLQRVVERVTRFFVPEQRKFAQHFGVGNCGFQIEATVGVNCQLARAAKFFEHGFNPCAVFIEGRATDLHFDHRVAAVKVAAHLAAQRSHVFAGVVVATSRIHKHLRVSHQAVPLSEQAKKRLAGDLRHRVPDRHVKRADSNRSLTVAARLFVVHHRGPDAVRVKVGAGIIQQTLRFSLQNARRKAFANKSALAVAPVRVKAVADHAFAISKRIGYHRHQAGRHFGKVDVGVAYR